MAVTSWNVAGTGADNSGVGTLAWANPTRIQTDDASFAGVTFSGASATSHYLVASNFGFTSADVPSGATIDGVEVEWQRKYPAGASPILVTPGFSKYTLWNSGVVGTTKTETTVWETTETAHVLGSSSDLWGATLTQAIVTGSGFGAAVWCKDDGGEIAGDPTAYVDAVRIRVYYTAASSGHTKFLPAMGVG